MTQEESQLVKVESQPTVGEMLNSAIANIRNGEITSQHVDVLGKMMDLWERSEVRSAEKSFATAFVKLQSEIAKIEATKAVPGNSGETRYKFAPFEEIMRKARPALIANGFSVRFDNEYVDNRLFVTCTLMHTDGHKESSRFGVRVGQGPPKASEAQSDGAAQTYAKRFALCSALNIVIEHDSDGADDARNVGELIDWKEAVILEERCEGCGADKQAFLTYAGAKSFDEIPKNRLEALNKMLTKKEAAKREVEGA